MSRTELALAAAVLLAAAACAPVDAAPAAVHGKPSAPVDAAPAAVHGKPSAPVAVEAELAESAARVTVRFDADAKAVRVAVGGAGGLVVRSAAVPVDGASFARGEVASLDVAFTPGPGLSHLAVTVTGKFRGAGRRSTARSFAIGAPTPEQLEAGGKVLEGGGERVKVVVPRN